MLIRDRATITSKHILPDGSWIFAARLGRVGVQQYVLPDGTVENRYRPADEVFSQSSLDTYRGAAVTIDHPSGGQDVRGDNFNSLAVGSVDSPVNIDDIWVGANVRVYASQAKAIVYDGVSGLSVGYDVAMETLNPPQEFLDPVDGQSYLCSKLMKSIVVNHVALTDSPRAGSGARLVLDSKDKQMIVKDFVEERNGKWVVVSESGDILGTHETKEDADKQLAAVEASKNATKDAVDPIAEVKAEAKEDAAIKLLQEAQAEEKAADEDEDEDEESEEDAKPSKFALKLHSPDGVEETLGEYDSADLARAAMKGVNDSVEPLKAEIAKLSTALRDATSPASLNAMIQDLDKVRQVAKSHSVQVTDSMSANDIRLAVVKSIFPALPADKLGSLADPSVFGAVVPARTSPSIRDSETTATVTLPSALNPTDERIVKAYLAQR